ncbi:YggS family pyridoxal phosphate-dependent enzyme [Pelotomaculum propionicicum]|uniref:Pyridoxal phosphate homeostasis protein n=1 Tax=Pelotomaculum propionicicum TaxID=258475 RepID=A0A4Y7RMT3_9FIRM|nr:YggS family pyridoxal phosphate-dependent enzyme [Pelotomaculum propionicicum]NLI12872.1 YggS family pyridoxal phosphate-dependent enzyme [Peptococcaceae bacterium]TEB10298.1 hypothetical protein Pmgp_02495 [Pelotomaculum propionicicum]
MSVLENLSSVRERIRAAALRSGRRDEGIRLVAVSKNMGVDLIKEALGCGVSCFGENKAQEFLKKYPQLPPELEWHFIGHLQTNKVRKVLSAVSLIHSLDRWSLAEEIHRVASETNKKAQALVQVNVAGEESKYGIAPAEAEDFVAEVTRLQGIRLRGLMTIAPECEDPEEVRYVFRQARELSRRLEERIQGLKMEYLSMGMSGDFEIAVEEGANMLRLGTAVFGRRY